MRGTRWLILLAIVSILGGSAYYYQKLKRENRNRIPKAPPVMSTETNSTAVDYEYAQSSGGFASFEVKAKTYRQVRDTPNYELTGLVLKLNQKDKKHYDLIKSATATFNSEQAKMYSDGAVEITLDIPIDGQIKHKLTTIKTSGVTFDSKTGKAMTERAVEFTFETGGGKCVGAVYDPSTRDLHLSNNPTMTMMGKGPNAKPMDVEAGEIVYRENGGLVWLMPWSKMKRAETTIDAGNSTVKLNHGKVETIDAAQATGVDKYPKRELHYSADSLHVTYDDNGEVNQITGGGHAKMHQESEGAVTDMTSGNAQLDFAPVNHESLLQHVVAGPDGVVTSKPGPQASGRVAESRVMKANYLDIAMRPDGKNIDTLKTLAPGTLEFLPNEPDQHRRFLTGDRMTVTYAGNNVIKAFQATNSTTLTFPAANNKTKNPQPSKTVSKTLDATFDSKGQLATMRQVDNFTYEEGDRRAKAAKATLDQAANTMDLETGARIWDSSGTTDADKIHMLQKTGDYIADGNVTTSRLPDEESEKKKQQKGGEMLDGDEPIQGTAPHMTSTDHNKRVHYEGGAALWQGSDRVEAQTIDIDRAKHTLTADGKVTTQFLDESKQPDESKKNAEPDVKKPEVKTSGGDGPKIVKASVKVPVKAAKSVPESGNKGPDNKDRDDESTAPVYTVVTADTLLYTDTDRLAHYSGNVDLARPGLHVTAADLNAFLNPKDHPDQDSRLNRAIGDGKVDIAESRPDRKRIGRGEHGEYTPQENKIVLRGNLADLYDSIKKDESHGSELTYFTTDDRLEIKGAPSQPVTSRLHRKTHANANPGNR